MTVDKTVGMTVDTTVGSVHPEWSGKMDTLHRLMSAMRKAGDDRIVVVSNYTSALDLIGTMCRENDWPYCRLDGRYSYCCCSTA
jgi:SNF2 family DNA or RNA helicase